MKQGWEIKKLGEICESDLGKTLNQSKDKGELYPYLCSINVLWDKFDFTVVKQARFDDKELERYTVRKGDLLICEGGDIGRAAIWNQDNPILYQNALHRVRLINNDVIPRFVMLFLKYLKLSGVLDTRYGKGVTIKHLVKSSLLSIPIPVPERAEQERIVGELDCLSGIIANKRAQLRELDSLAQSIFYTMFGDPITNDKGWQTKALGDVARIINGYAFDSKLFSTDKNDMPLIRIRDIKKGYTETFYKGKYPNTYIIKNGDYIIGMDGEFNIVEWRGGTALLNQRVCKIEFIDDEVIGRYALRFLSIELKRIEDATSFVTVKHLSSKSLISIFIPIPPIDLQKQFAEKIENIERQKELITKSIKETEDLFNSRMSYYFD